MNAFRTFVKVTRPRRIVLKDVPFDAGQDVEVLVLPREETEARKATGNIAALMRDTQALPQIKRISERNIAAEIRAVRSAP